MHDFKVIRVDKLKFTGIRILAPLWVRDQISRGKTISFDVGNDSVLMAK